MGRALVPNLLGCLPWRSRAGVPVSPSVGTGRTPPWLRGGSVTAAPVLALIRN